MTNTVKVSLHHKFLKHMHHVVSGAIALVFWISFVPQGFAAVLEGPYPLLVTPWTEEAELDVPVLVKEAEFVERTGSSGIIWPTSVEVEALDATGEYEAGLQALAERASKPGAEFNSRLTAVCS